jgi:hypothetical protein
MEMFEANKEDLRRRNRELRHKMIVKAQEAAKKNTETEKNNSEKNSQEELQKQVKYPDIVLTMLKRLRRISPWSDIVTMSSYQSALISYFKLKQLGMKEIKLAANAIHAWVEFSYDNRWWTFDPAAIKNTALGQPIKSKLLATEIEYTTLTRYFEKPSDFFSYYETSIDITIDDAKIIAMEDDALNSIKLNYH